MTRHHLSVFRLLLRIQNWLDLIGGGVAECQHLVALLWSGQRGVLMQGVQLLCLIVQDRPDLLLLVVRQVQRLGQPLQPFVSGHRLARPMPGIGSWRHLRIQRRSAAYDGNSQQSAKYGFLHSAKLPRNSPPGAAGHEQGCRRNGRAGRVHHQHHGIEFSEHP